MLEYMLAYELDGLHIQHLTDLLAADLDEDARQFFTRMAADIGVAAAAAGRTSQPLIVRTLLMTLIAAPEAKTASWRHLYRRISYLVAGCTHVDDPAIDRLRAFLRENVDLADSPAYKAFASTAYAGAVHA